ncbi:MAG TPA: DNA-formamidopyrimidine glycosylase family protein [Myxococcales bacterium]|jgi:endonuclease-8
MPEGDTIFRAATALRKALQGARVLQMRSSMLAGPYPVGERILSVEARGKNLVLRFENGRVLRTHMMMSGSWHLYRDGEKWQRPAWQARLELRADNGFCAVLFNAPVVEWLDAREAPLARLGPDATSDGFDAAAAFSRLRARPDRAVGEVLLDQAALSGVGNVIKCEALFRCRANPFAKVSDVPDDELEKLIADARKLLVQNREKGPRTTRTSLDGGRFWVYGRSGKPCLICGTAIRMRRQGEAARSTYFCASCQKV